jgi:hypothetical protein
MLPGKARSKICRIKVVCTPLQAARQLEFFILINIRDFIATSSFDC